MQGADGEKENPGKLRKKLLKRSRNGTICSFSQATQCAELSVPLAPSLTFTKERISAHSFRRFLLASCGAGDGTGDLRLANPGAVKSMVVACLRGVANFRDASSGPAAEGLRHLPDLQHHPAGVAAFEGERANDMVQTLLYAKKDRGSARSGRKRRKLIEGQTAAAALPPIESYVHTLEKLGAVGYAFAPALAALGDDGASAPSVKETAVLRETMGGVNEDPGRLLMTAEGADELVRACTPLDSGGVEYRCTPPCSDGTRKPRIFAMDCEMVQTEAGMELARISIVEYRGPKYTGQIAVAPATGAEENGERNEAKEADKIEEKNEEKYGDEEDDEAEAEDDGAVVLLDAFVLPEAPVVDYVTKFSGVTEEILRGAAARFVQARAAVLRLVRRQDVLIGHGLENDLKVLRVAHGRVVDTAVLYPHPMGPPKRPSLRFLSQTILGRRIHRNDSSAGHCSVEDARTALALACTKFDNGHHFGTDSRVSGKDSVAQLIAAYGVRGEAGADASAATGVPGAAAAWMGSPGDLRVHARPGVRAVPVASWTDAAVREGVRDGLHPGSEAAGEEQRRVLFVTASVQELRAAQGLAPPAAGGDGGDLGISSAKVDALKAQGSCADDLQAVDGFLRALMGGAAEATGGTSKTLFLLLTQVDVDAHIVPVMRQRQACQSVRSTSIWTNRQQTLLEAMVESARTAGLSYGFA